MPIRWRVLDKEDYKDILISACLLILALIGPFLIYPPFYALILTLPWPFPLILFILDKLKKKGVHKAVILYRIISIVGVIALLISIYYVLYEWKLDVPT
ncbi:MAG: hypothetical protein DRN53_00010 [Thermoprotei archaeon]|nr:MAG: hypothetical protein DRN53_00010 [Thermoprotei archaeon]